MIFLKLIKKFVKLLNSDASPNQMAAGFAFGSIIGLTPFFSLHNIAVWVLIFLLRVNVSSAFLGVAVWSLIGFAADPLSDRVGYLVLAQTEALYPLWTALYNMPIVPYTHFYNTIVMGGLVIALVLFIPQMLIMKRFIIVYRSRLQERLGKIKVFQILKASKFYQWYDRLRN